MEATEAISVSKNKILLSLYVTPGARNNCFPTGYNPWRKSIEISVKGVAKDNKANKDVLVVLANFFNLPLRNITIVSGVNSREKVVALSGMSKETVDKVLEDSFYELSTCA